MELEEFYPDKEDCKDIINEEIRLKDAVEKEIQDRAEFVVPIRIIKQLNHYGIKKMF